MADSPEAWRRDVEEEATQEYSAAFDSNGLNRYVQRIGSLFSAAGLPTEGHAAFANVQNALVRMLLVGDALVGDGDTGRVNDRGSG